MRQVLTRLVRAMDPMHHDSYPLPVMFRKFVFEVTRWFGGAHPALFSLLMLGCMNPFNLYVAIVKTFELTKEPPHPFNVLLVVPCLVLLAAAMYCAARMRGLSHGAATDVLRGRRYFDGRPVVHPMAVGGA